MDPEKSEKYVWDTGELARYASFSKGIRISDRGIRFIPFSFTPKDRQGLDGKWKSVTCYSGKGEFSRFGLPAGTFSKGALCTTDNGSPVFPQEASHVLITDNRNSIDTVFMRQINKGECTRFSGRTMVSNYSSYTVSLCDISQKNMDFFYDFDTLFVRKKSEGWPFYLLMCICLVIIITSISQNIAHLLGDQDEPVSGWIGIMTCLLLIIVVVCTTGQGGSFVTEEDNFFYLFVVLYVSFYVVLWIMKYFILPINYVDVPVNVLVGSILLGVCRLYDGIECVYMFPILVLLSVRASYKAISFFVSIPEIDDDNAHTHKDKEHNKSQLYEFSIFREIASSREPLISHEIVETMFRYSIPLDFLLIGLSHQHGFKPLFYKSHNADAYFLVVFLFSFNLAMIAWRRNSKQLQ